MVGEVKICFYFIMNVEGSFIRMWLYVVYMYIKLKDDINILMSLAVNQTGKNLKQLLILSE